MLIDDIRLPHGCLPSLWNKLLPIKVNLFCWRLLLNFLHMKDNLVNHGIVIPSMLCLICGDFVEEIDHVFLDCDVARSVFSKLKKWCDVTFPHITSI